MTLRALIVDDEPIARRRLKTLLKAEPTVQVAGECEDGESALNAIRALRPDLVFLDVQMPEMSGFDVLRARGPERMPAVVFVTAHDQFAVQAFEAQALDYLVKPLNVERFEAALTRARERLRMVEAVDLAARLSALLAEEHAATRDRLVVPTAGGELVIPVDEIDWIGAEDYYACLYVAGKRHLTRESLASLETHLDPRQFVRVHRSAIIRLDRIRRLRTTFSGDTVVLRDGTVVPVSRRRRQALEERLRR